MNTFFRSTSIAIALATLSFVSQAALAAPDDRPSFREFREQNSGIDRNAARKMFHQQFGRGAHAGSAASGISAVNPFDHVITVGPNGEAVCGGAILPSIDRGNIRVRNQSMQMLGNQFSRVNRGGEIDLGSSDKNIVLGRSLFGANDSISILVNGKETTLQAGAQVTAAEYVAVKQVLSGGGQQVALDRSGRASGGSVDLGALTNENDVMRASSLVVPKDVTTYGDFGRKSDFRLQGDLTNFGTVSTSSSDISVRGGGIHADNIYNNSGALISATGDLELRAAAKLTNAGTIDAMGTLTLSAASLSNTGNVSSSGDLNINSASVVNRGSLSSGGNLNLNSDGQLLVDNRKGTISANNAINVRDYSYAGTQDVYLVGGNLLSRELNLNSGLGVVNVDVNELTGSINETGTAAHVKANTSALNLGSICLTGDPTFFNTAGNILINGNIDVQEDLVFAAAGDILTADNITIRAGDATTGYNITFISGASFTSVTGTNTPNVGPISGAPPYSGAGSVTLSAKGSKAGGGIYLGINTLVTSRSTDNASNRNGGDISFFAFGKAQGVIKLDTATVESGGQLAGSHGDIVIASGANASELIPIALGAIDTTNQVDDAGLGGNLTVVNSAAIIQGGKTVTYNANGTLAPGGFFIAGTKLNKISAIQFSGDTLIAGDLTARGAGVIVDAPVTAFGTANAFATTALISTGNGPLLGFDGVTLATGKKGVISGGDPGSAFPFEVGGPFVVLNAPGGFVLAELVGTGGIFLTSTGAEFLDVTAPTLALFGDVSANTVVNLAAISFNFSSPVRAEQIYLSSLDPIVDGDYIGDFVGMVAPSIGTMGSPFVVNAAVKGFGFFTNDPTNSDAYITFSNSKSTNIFESGADNIVIRSVGSLTFLSNVEALSVLDIATTAGTITVGENVSLSAGTDLFLANSAAKGKIIFDEGSTVEALAKTAGLGNVSITLGAGGGSPIGDPANLSVNEVGTGVVSFLGLGLTSKGLSNSVNAINANVIISNTVSAKNILMSGNATITADPPAESVFVF